MPSKIILGSLKDYKVKYYIKYLYFNVELVFEPFWSSTIDVDFFYQYLECALELVFLILYIEELNSRLLDSLDMK